MNQEKPTTLAEVDNGPAETGEPSSSAVTLSATQGRASGWRHAAPVGIFAMVVIAFMPALLAGFVNWDDDVLVLQNTLYRSLTAESVGWWFSTSFAGHFQPLTWASYAFDYALWGPNPVGYHLTNLMLHGLTAVAFYFLVRRLLVAGCGERAAGFSPRGPAVLSEGSPLPHGRGSECYESKLDSAALVLSATFAALLFAVHPLRVESVAWIAERRDVLGGLFYVLAVVCYLRYVAELTKSGSEKRLRTPSADEASVSTPDDQEKDTGPKPVPHEPVPDDLTFYFLSLGLCAVSLMAKASAVTLVFVLLILDVYPLRRFWPAHLRSRFGSEVPARLRSRFGSEVSARLRSRFGSARVWVEKLPFLALSVAAGLRALYAQSASGALETLAAHDLPSRLAQSCYGLTFYLFKTLWPTNLGPMYEIPPRSVLLGPMLWISAACVVVLAVLVIGLRKRYPAVAAGLAVYVVVLMPVLGILQSGRQLVADRYSYLSCMVLAVLGGALLFKLLSSAPRSTSRHRKPISTLIATVLVVLLSHQTFAQCEIWQWRLSLWEHGVKVSPNSSIAHVNYADALARAQDYGTAWEHYTKGLKINPDDPIAWHHLADVQRILRQNDLAIDSYLEALKRDPSRRGAHLPFARLLVDRGDVLNALKTLRDGARRTPDELEMVRYLAELLATHPDPAVRDGEEAFQWARYVVSARPQPNLDDLLTLSNALAETGRFEEAIEVIKRLLALMEETASPETVEKLNRRLALFAEGKPYHTSPDNSPRSTQRSQRGDRKELSEADAE